MKASNENRELVIKLTDVKKMYKLGKIGGGTLQADIQSWWAQKRGLEDPNTKIGEQRLIGSTFMALNGIDLEVHKGEALGIIGANGAGKSTMLKLLSRVTAPTSGKIQIWGRVASMLEVGTGFHGEMTGRENIYMNGAILGMSKAEIDAKIEDIIEFSEVREFIDTPVKRYSSGMYVKLAFSVAAHLDSEIMIMDEVLAVGDMAFQKKCLAKMRDIAKKEGRTVLYVSHNMSTIRQLCDRCVVLEKGKVVFDGDVNRAIDRYINAEKKESGIINYKTWERDNWYNRDRIRLWNLSLINHEACVFERTEPAIMEWLIHAEEPVHDFAIRMEIRDETDSPIGVYSIYEIDLAEGENRIKVKLDVSMLSPGSYHSIIILFTLCGIKAFQTEDSVPGIAFSVVDTKENDRRIKWNRRGMGYVIFPDMMRTE